MLLSVRKMDPCVAAALGATANVKASSLRDIFMPAMAKTQQQLLTEPGKPDQVQINMTAFLLRHEHALVEDMEANDAAFKPLFDAANRCKQVKDIAAESKAASAAKEGSVDLPSITAAA